MARAPVLYFHRASAESGIDAWDHEVLAIATTLEEAHELERRFISKLKTFDSDYGYNLTHGGDGCVATEETRRKLSESHQGPRKPHSDETKAKLREALLARRPCCVSNRSTSSTMTVI
jgi:hypothetical protein